MNCKIPRAALGDRAERLKPLSTEALGNQVMERARLGNNLLPHRQIPSGSGQEGWEIL